MPRCLIITNDFPPRRGGIETFVYELARRFPAREVVVYTSDEPGAEAFDRGLPFPVVRDRSRTLLPTRAVARTARRLIAEYGCDSVWFGAAAPLGLLAGQLGGVPSVATTHGHEVWWASVPGARQILHKIGERVGTVTYLTEYTRARIAPALGPRAHTARLVPGVDSTRFHPDVDGTPIREHYGLGDRPVILSVSRLVPRKGQDQLIRAMPRVRRAVPGATLLIVGSGPQDFWLRGMAPDDAVVFAGGLPHDELPPFYAAADVFAMPCRNRRLGLETEGLGIVFLEAAAAGLPVLAGDSGGAPEAVRDGETGYVVDGGSVAEITARLIELLTAEDGRMGERGRAWAEADWTWDRSYDRLRGLLSRASPTVRA
ncbi:glycosyltransferase family 4 protein [Actinomadura rudentiformis]|uniref:Glycosyltransferase family 4 protein n=1 Tax=Actinomadura rudentiformis TaxID=359158 RepID=A0A6H9YNG0_9ACTN|nr:glycosyltransferase family 4 protein [Actinomadura rudentiformis]KAB2341352.1 glycosyltransferase family 4 protein [Actinomadura rudentiformis]